MFHFKYKRIHLRNMVGREGFEPSTFRCLRGVVSAERSSQAELPAPVFTTRHIYLNFYRYAAVDAVASSSSLSSSRSPTLTSSASSANVASSATDGSSLSSPYSRRLNATK